MIWRHPLNQQSQTLCICVGNVTLANQTRMPISTNIVSGKLLFQSYIPWVTWNYASLSQFVSRDNTR